VVITCSMAVMISSVVVSGCAVPRIRIKSEAAMPVVMPSCLCETACDSEHSSTTSGMRYLASVCLVVKVMGRGGAFWCVYWCGW
jgi:hypothetical protein